MTPKQEFQESEHAKRYLDVIDSSRMQAAFKAAMLEFQASFPMASDMATAAANEWRRQGAQQFLRELCTLTINPKPKPAPPGGTIYKG